jgi:SNF2 family DNA or RNA helicase
LLGINQGLTQENARYGLFDEPGCGKTLPAQALGLYYAGFGNRVLVLMPPVLLKQFAASLAATFSGVGRYFTLHQLSEPPKKREQLFAGWDKTRAWPTFLLMSYQMWIRDDVYPRVVKAGYDVMIPDEAHALKNPGSKVHKVAAKWQGEEGERAFIPMTGTPIANELIDAYGLIKLLTPSAYRSKRSFERIHCVYVDVGGFRKLVDYRNEPLLTKNLYRQAQRVRTSEVLSLEKPTIQTVPMVLHDRHRTLYDKLVNERFLEVQGQIIDAVTAQSLRQKCLRIVTNPHEFADRPPPNVVLDTLEELAKSIGVEREKVVVFANFQESVRTIQRHFAAYNPAVVYGGSDSVKEKDKFLEDSSCRMAVMHPKSGGVGLDGMQNVCKYVVFAEPVSTPGDFDQAMRRVYRPGQKHAVVVYILKAIGTIAPSLTRNMLRKGRATVDVQQDRNTLLSELLGGGDNDDDDEEVYDA